MALEHLVLTDDGTRDLPGEDSAWLEWVSASKGRNFVLGEPLLDWLDLYGSDKGFVPDNELPGYDERFDFGSRIMNQGNAFEAAALRWLEERFDMVSVSTGWRDTRDRAAAERTFQAMMEGREIISQAVLWNPQTRTYGAPDLLVRSDVLNRLVPGTLSEEGTVIAAPALDGAGYHYRVVDIKISTLHLSADGHAKAGDHGPFLTQLWIYNDALGRLQGFTPPSAYLLGRSTILGGVRSTSALDRLGRVDRDHVLKGGVTLAAHAAQACAWIRRVRSEGRNWDVLPEPSVPELTPHPKNDESSSWGGAKGQIISELGLRDPKPVTSPLVLPTRVHANEGLWRRPVPAEFYVDFETTLDLYDDFAAFPEKGAAPLIYMTGCGWLEDPLDPATWQFRCFVADRLTEEDEARMLDAWIAFMRETCEERGTTLKDARLFHWHWAEPSFLETAYNSSVVRHGQHDWASLPWVDLLHALFKAEPILVGGTSGYGLKEIARALHAEGIIDTLWSDGVGGGMEAMAGAWWADAEAAKTGGSMRDFDVMEAIERYNEIDCRVMAEILAWLRRER
jgi:predicted RecB family nuclease